MDKKLFTLAIDWSEGKTPTYESWRKWLTTEENARRMFARSLVCGRRSALVSSDGRILVSHDDAADWR